MTTLADKLNNLIHHRSPFEGLDASAYPFRVQGWGSTHPIFRQLIEQTKPSLIVEVGTWKGASAFNMIMNARRFGDAAIICVDTWLGSAEHWIEDDLRRLIEFRNGRPILYEQFLANVVHAGFQDAVVPLPLPSRLASMVLAHFGLKPSIVYIDGAHDELSVREDIVSYRPLIHPTGIMLGDDYGTWPGVTQAVDAFLAERKGELMTNGIVDNKWFAQKSA